MPSNVISSFEAFSKKFEVEGNEERIIALKKYFKRGGVISAVKSQKPWPKVVYPSPIRLDAQINELKDRREHFVKKNREWKAKLNEARTYHTRHHILKLKEPLYWKHMQKILMDKEYRQDSEVVGLPVHLAADARYRPMIKMFLEDDEYRKNLVETVQHSSVYKNKKVGNYATVLQEFRTEVSENQLKDIAEKIGELDEEIKSMEIIRRWTAE